MKMPSAHVSHTRRSECTCLPLTRTLMLLGLIYEHHCLCAALRGKGHTRRDGLDHFQGFSQIHEETGQKATPHYFAIPS